MKFVGLRHLEGATVCVKPQTTNTNPQRYEEDKLCANACCPANTCDTAPLCNANSLTGEKEFDGERKPLAMKSK